MLFIHAYLGFPRCFLFSDNVSTLYTIIGAKFSTRKSLTGSGKVHLIYFMYTNYIYYSGNLNSIKELHIFLNMDIVTNKKPPGLMVVKN